MVYSHSKQPGGVWITSEATGDKESSGRNTVGYGIQGLGTRAQQQHGWQKLGDRGHLKD
jgi:hypothetical protein